MFSRLCRASARLASTAARASASTSATTASYPFSKTALLPTLSAESTPALRDGKGIMRHLQESLYSPRKAEMMKTLFSRRSPKQLRVGSIISIISDQAPTVFNGVLIAIRRRGPDTSIRVRNILQRTGVEVQFFVNSPGLKEIKLLKPPPKGRMRRAKLFYLRDSPEKMSMLAAGKH